MCDVCVLCVLCVVCGVVWCGVWFVRGVCVCLFALQGTLSTEFAAQVGLALPFKSLLAAFPSPTSCKLFYMRNECFKVLLSRAHTKILETLRSRDHLFPKNFVLWATPFSVHPV